MCLLAVPWTYSSEILWPTTYPKCGDPYQSPIDVVVNEVVAVAFDEISHNIGLLYIIKLHNNGRYVTGHLELGLLDTPTVRIGNGPQYKFDHFRFHWRKEGAPSSENSINGRHYDCEFHYVFINEKYVDFDEATNHDDGLLIISVLCVIDDSLKDKTFLTDILLEVEKIANFNTDAYTAKVPIFDFIKDLLKVDSSHAYFKYRGSLTTPPCAGADIILLKDPKHIQRVEYDAFLPLEDENNKPIYTNVRGIKPKDGRIVN
ncbi:carbonic anhydrase 6-like, partial [Musca vetustissima]|uniref:carbonic anhydrase 6-like n=1 Tax=Musca vetustissima TaxID=27455 RepID=UPI002AB71E19